MHVLAGIPRLITKPGRKRKSNLAGVVETAMAPRRDRDVRGQLRSLVIILLKEDALIVNSSEGATDLAGGAKPIGKARRSQLPLEASVLDYEVLRAQRVKIAIGQRAG